MEVPVAGDVVKRVVLKSEINDMLDLVILK
jgi:hypothetical protein